MSIVLPFLTSLNDLFWENPWAQLIGLLALIVGVSAFLQKHDDHLRRNLTIFTLLMGIQFMMLGLWAGALTAWLGTLRNYISMRTKNIWVMAGFLLILWLVALPNATEIVDYFPIVGTSLGTWAMFREKGLRMRSLMFLGSACWLSHNFLVGSIGGTIIEAVFLVVNGRTMFKLFAEQTKTSKNN
ncbi:YgjV family protein [Paraglaciecola hydrolytica]|uniref:YgjV family protein n=1 Tax=Paraglaciecola hydrolytica TaxID=1799789 RepID=A0A136A1J0_9ALTE|nr:YgjV family protein [Paraglaciecola hydrolytica]KXI29063.1 hypothetical protein AX660_12935 [Paraglaciecola hydrolytica]